jgi:hypothetical protein
MPNKNIVCIRKSDKIIHFATVLVTAEHAVAQWLRHYATNWQVAGSIPDGVIGIFQ